MALNKNNKGKKDILKGAMDNEISSEGLMGEFIDNVKSDKNGDTSSSDKQRQLPEAGRSLSRKEKSKFGEILPMIRNANQKEWWVSLGAFASIILLVVILFWSFGGGNTYQLHLASSAIDNFSYGAATETDVYEIGKPVYVYFASKSEMKTKKIFIHVINMNETSEESRMAVIESNINPKWKLVETHFQKEYFETPGKYKILIENEDKKVLIERIFTVK